MNKKLLSLLMTGTIVGTVGAGAVATMPSAPTSQKSTKNNILLAEPSSTTTSKQTTDNSATKQTTTNQSNSDTSSKAQTNTKKDHHKSFHIDKKLVKEGLLKGQTVSQIKSSLISNFNSNITKRVSEKKISQDKANQLEKDFAAQIQKTNILKDVVVNSAITKDLNSGKTLSQAKQDLISAKTAKINSLVSQKKLTQERATKMETALKNRINKGQGIFLNEGMVNKIRKDINSGMTVSQSKEALVKQADAKLQTLVKEGKMKSENLPKAEKHMEKQIDNNPAFKHISNVGWVQKALNDGQTTSQIKATISSKINQKESKVDANTHLSSTQKSKIKTHLQKVLNNISSKGIFTLSN